jgi:IS30 family transposase
VSDKSKGHLTWEEMVRIETLLDQGLTITEIGIVIGRNKSVVSRCISNNSVDGNFTAEKAWQIVYERKREANTHNRLVKCSSHFGSTIKTKPCRKMGLFYWV